jgi:hypothetical protein
MLARSTKSLRIDLTKAVNKRELTFPVVQVLTPGDFFVLFLFYLFVLLNNAGLESLSLPEQNV